MQTTTIYMFGFSKETSNLDGSFEYPEVNSPNDISNH